MPTSTVIGSRTAGWSPTSAASPTRRFSPGGADGVLLLRHHGLHVEIVIDPDHPIGRTDKAGVADIRLESALTAIMDCEDSVAAVDAEEKIAVYRNWLGLMKGTLSASFDKGGGTIERRRGAGQGLDGDTHAQGPRADVRAQCRPSDGQSDDAARRRGGARGAGRRGDSPRCIAAPRRARRAGQQPRRARSTSSSPRCTGPRKPPSPTACSTRSRICSASPRHTIKIGLMDEERRTSVNLAACIHAVKDRIVFINTGFLDRTGDEIHTSMKLGPMIRKAEMKSAAWLKAYEDNNVDTGLACGFAGRAQIGKGMWAMPDLMARHARAEDRPSRGRGEHRLGPLPHRRHPPRRPLSPRRRRRAPARACRTGAGKRGDMLTIPVAAERNWSRGGDRRGAGQQCPGHIGLCRALDRPGRRLLEGARRSRCRPDGGPRHLPDLQPACRQLAASRRGRAQSRSRRRC